MTVQKVFMTRVSNVGSTLQEYTLSRRRVVPPVPAQHSIRPPVGRVPGVRVQRGGGPQPRLRRSLVLHQAFLL